ncbi:MAG: sulfotransferase family protein [Rhodospirillaceae bacterium]
MSRPVLVLSAPRSYSSLFGTMLGQHPDLYGLPEVKLFLADTVGSLITRFQWAHVQRLHGLYRVIGQIEFGGQTDETVRQAKAWLNARRSWTTERMWTHLAQAAAPQALLEAAPVTAMFPGSLQRARRICPEARYIHLTRHPGPSCASIQASLRWLDKRYHTPLRFFVDPEKVWRRAHRNICAFVATLPEDRVLRLRGEDLMADAPAVLDRVTAFLGLAMDAAALEAMLHPEHSIYAHEGPPLAPMGSDPKFLADPTFRPSPVTLVPLSETKSPKGRPLAPETLRVAKQIGYD